mgnify:CR=1 FL=1
MGKSVAMDEVSPEFLGRGPIFILGCPRSGTTILQAALISRSEIFSFPETQLPYRLLHDIAWPLKKGGRSTREFWALSNRLGFSRKDSRQLLGNAERVISNSEPKLQFPRRMTLRAAIRDYVKLVERYANGQLWLEKSPLNVLCTRYIQDTLPDARFVHVVRRAEDVVASMVEASKTHPPFRKFSGADGWRSAFVLWKNCVSSTIDVSAESAHIVVNYHKFVEKPDQVLQEISSHLHTPLAPESLEVDLSSIARSQENWKFERGTKIRKLPSRAVAVLGEERVDFIRTHAEPFELKALSAVS